MLFALMSSSQRSLDNETQDIHVLSFKKDLSLPRGKIKNTEEKCVPLKLDIPICNFSGAKPKTIFSTLFLAQNCRQCAGCNFSRAFRLVMILKNPKIYYHSSLDPSLITVRHSSEI